MLLALAAVNLVADFAKVRAVVEDRRSMLGAIVASLRFIRRRHVRVAGLYLLNVLAALDRHATVDVAGAGRNGAVVVARCSSRRSICWCAIWAKLAFMASEVVFFQGELAHATYTASAPLVWPDSAAVEAIDNLVSNKN